MLSYESYRDPSATSDKCRVCALERESVPHFGRCVGLRPVYQALRAIDKGVSWDQAPLNLHGVTLQGGVVPPGRSIIHMCVWKEIIKEMMQDKFNATAVLRRAAERIHSRLEGYTRKKLNEKLTLEAKGREANSKSIHNKLEGITFIDDDGDVMMDPLIKRWIEFHKSIKIHTPA